jgi:hypothetical protein
MGIPRPPIQNFEKNKIKLKIGQKLICLLLDHVSRKKEKIKILGLNMY